MTEKKTAYVICVNDYPVEVAFLDELGTLKRVAELQERLDEEDRVSLDRSTQCFVHYHTCPVIDGREEDLLKRGELVIWRSSTYYGDARPDELAIVAVDGGKNGVRIMRVRDLEEHWVDRENVRQAKQLAWIIRYVVEEGFGERHLEALAHIVGLFNDCEESEREIFVFADKLYERYAG